MSEQPPPPSTLAAAEALRRQGSAQLKASLRALKRDVAASIRLCSRDFAVLGQELVDALQHKARREHAVRHALEHERKRRRKLQHQVADQQQQQQTQQGCSNIRVLCRVRPVLSHETDESSGAGSAQQQLNDSTSSNSPQQKQMRIRVDSQQELKVCSVVDGTLYKSFSFYRVFDGESTQHHVFKDVAPLVIAAVEGQHSCIFAYGQIGAGKTHTMQGPEGDRGVYFRATDLIYNTTQELQPLYDFTVTMQLVEIYNEEVYDLLVHPSAQLSSNFQQQSSTQLFNPPTTGTSSSYTYPPGASRPALEIRHGERGVYLKNVTTILVENADQVHSAIERGAANRSVHAIEKNEQSNRSHTVLMIDIERKSKASGDVDTGRLVLVDLAGSERLSKTETTGQRLREAQYINKSLCAISDVMSALRAKEKHIPFRNSKLTHMLQDSLGGDNSNTLMFVHVSPTSADVSETIDTLKFASRVSHIRLGSSNRRTERLEINRLNGIITTQAAQLQTMQDKLASELELRKKYEKRLEEYRQEENRRKAREDELKRQQTLAPLSSSAPILSPTEQPFATRRWSLYSRSRDSIALKSANNAKGLNGVENISENILRSRSTLTSLPEDSTFGITTPMRQKRRLSLFQADKSQGIAALGSQQPTKRPRSTAPEVRSILKKRRVEEPQHSDGSANGSVPAKQVSFHISPKSSPSDTSAPPQLLRTTPAASRVPTASRVRASTSSFNSPVRRVVASTPARVKPKWNGGWR
ncbi:Kinesin-like protein, partial [Globisporangium splendens]